MDLRQGLVLILAEKLQGSTSWSRVLEAREARALHELRATIGSVPIINQVVFAAVPLVVPPLKSDLVDLSRYRMAQPTVEIGVVIPCIPVNVG